MSILEDARFKIVINSNTVFVSSLLLRQNQKITEDVKTMAVNGTTLFVNPTFAESLTVPECMGVLCHEIWHIALRHMFRGKEKDNQQKWDQACEYVVNLLVLEMGLTLPKTDFINHNFKGLSTDEVYDLLPDPPYDPDYQSIFPQLEEGEDPNEVEQDIIVSTLAAAKAAKTAGQKIPSVIDVMLKDILEPKVAWQQYLNQYFTDRIKAERSYKKRNRRYPNIIMPACLSDNLGLIRFYVDISGSVTDEQFQQYVSEIHHIQTTYRPKELEIVEFDHEVRKIHRLTQENSVLDIQFTGRGGTLIQPVYDHMITSQAEVNIIITDGWFTQHKEPDEEIIWLIDDNPHFDSESLVIHI